MANTTGGFTAGETKRARRISIESTLVIIGAVAAMEFAYPHLVNGINRWHSDHARSVAWWQQVLLYVVALQGTIVVVRSATTIARRLIVGRRHGLGQRVTGQFLRAVAVSAAVQLALTATTVLIVWTAARTSSWAWLAVGPIFAAASTVTSIHALQQYRWMYQLEPLTDQRSMAILHDLLGPERLATVGLWLLPISATGPQINGFVCGSGFRRRALVIFDTALSLPDAELRSMLAHEVGHLELDHVRARVGLIVAVTGLAALGAMALAPSVGVFGAERAAWNEGRFVPGPAAPEAAPGHTVVPVTETFDGRRFRVASWVIDVPIRALPLEVMDFIWLQILITLIGVLVVVLPRARRQEREADRYALDRTADPDAFVAMIHSVSVIAGIRPNRTPIGSMGCTHAPPAQRMALAHEWAWNQQRNQVT